MPGLAVQVVGGTGVGYGIRWLVACGLELKGRGQCVCQADVVDAVAMREANSGQFVKMIWLDAGSGY